MKDKREAYKRLFDLSPDKIKEYFIDIIEKNKNKELAWRDDKKHAEKGMQKGKEEVEDLVWSMYSYCVSYSTLLGDCGEYAVLECIKRDEKYGSNLLKYVKILEIANEINIDVDGYVEEYINYLTSLTCAIAHEESEDTSGVHITPLYKPLFNLITKMCENGKHERLFFQLSNFSVFANLPASLDGYKYYDFDKRPYEERVDTNMFNECLDEYLERLSYKETKSFLDQIYFYYDQANREDKKEQRDFTEYNREVSNNFWKRTRKRIEAAARDQIDLPMIKKSDYPLELISEKFPNITANSIFNYVFENEITNAYPSVSGYYRSFEKYGGGGEYINGYINRIIKNSVYWVRNRYRDDLLKGKLSIENKTKIIDCLLDNPNTKASKLRNIGAILSVLVDYFKEDGGNYLGNLLANEKEILKNREKVYNYTVNSYFESECINGRVIGYESRPYKTEKVDMKQKDFYLEDIKYIFQRDYEKYTPEARAEISQIIAELEIKKEDEDQ